jgi:hypothetical protein
VSPRERYTFSPQEEGERYTFSPQGEKGRGILFLSIERKVQLLCEKLAKRDAEGTVVWECKQS